MSLLEGQVRFATMAEKTLAGKELDENNRHGRPSKMPAGENLAQTPSASSRTEYQNPKNTEPKEPSHAPRSEGIKTREPLTRGGKELPIRPRNREHRSSEWSCRVRGEKVVSEYAHQASKRAVTTKEGPRRPKKAATSFKPQCKPKGPA